MLQIGEFAALTGLSVKALRHYDSEQVLCPAEVDEGSGYRYYGPEQVRSGVLVRTLRDAGVPLPDVAAALIAGTSATALATHHDRLLQVREREDRALRRAQLTLRELDSAIEVVERAMPEQPFAGYVLPLPRPGEELDAFDAAAREATVLPRLINEGIELDGRGWTTTTARDFESAQFVLCWATSVALPTDWAGPGEVVGVLPAGTDLVAIRHIDHDDEIANSPHPQIVALFDALAARGEPVEGIEIRQSVFNYGQPTYTVEVAARLRQPRSGGVTGARDT